MQKLQSKYNPKKWGSDLWHVVTHQTITNCSALGRLYLSNIPERKKLRLGLELCNLDDFDLSCTNNSFRDWTRKFWIDKWLDLKLGRLTVLVERLNCHTVVESYSCPAWVHACSVKSWWSANYMETFAVLLTDLYVCLYGHYIWKWHLKWAKCDGKSKPKLQYTNLYFLSLGAVSVVPLTDQMVTNINCRTATKTLSPAWWIWSRLFRSKS